MARKPTHDWAEVREFVLSSVQQGVPSLPNAIQTKFGVSRGTAYNYLGELIEDGSITRIATGKYELVHNRLDIPHVVEGLEEHRVWANEIAPRLSDLPDNVVDIWHYGCTEMINNVIDHSESQTILIQIDRTALETQVAVMDQGIGIFKKIADSLDLEDERHSVLELSKGKVTTDPENHTGEGIFFSSRAFDEFSILSRGIYFRHTRDEDEDWILGKDNEEADVEINGTAVFMALNNGSDKRLESIFDEFATDTEDYRFDRTVVPVKLLQYGDDRLVSRSQAKRLLQRFDRFRVVILDFEDVDNIGQAFADEVFRVFVSQHPEVDIVAVNANEQVSRMIRRASSH